MWALSLDSAEARIGRPLTATSVAGVSRRVHRRAYRRAVYGTAVAGLGGYATTAIALQPTPAIPHVTATTTPHLTATATPRLTGTATPRRTWATPHRTSVTRRISATPERSVIKSGTYAWDSIGASRVRPLDVSSYSCRCLESPGT